MYTHRYWSYIVLFKRSLYFFEHIKRREEEEREEKLFDIDIWTPNL